MNLYIFYDKEKEYYGKDRKMNGEKGASPCTQYRLGHSVEG